MSREKPSMERAIINAVANRENIEPEHLSVPLYDVIDPEALDSLFRDSFGYVTFRYHGYVVRIHHDRTVELLTDP